MTRHIKGIQWQVKSTLVMFETKWQELTRHIKENQWRNDKWNRNKTYIFLWNSYFVQWNWGGALGPCLAPSWAKWAARTLFVPGLYPVCNRFTVGWTGWLGCGCLAGSAGLAPTLCGRHIKNITKRISRNIDKYHQIPRNINKYDQIWTEQYQWKHMKSNSKSKVLPTQLLAFTHKTNIF